MTTIYDTFKKALPTFPPLGVQVETRARESGTTTAQCTPPMCGIRIPQNHWTNLATRLCLNHQNNKNALGNQFISNPLKSIVFKSEADVVKASTLYFMYPVHAAYELVYPDDLQLDQLTKPHKETTPASRVDMAYFKTKPDNETTPGNSSNVFAVLEYKKFRGIPRDQFNSGIVANYSDYEKAQENPLFDDTLDAKVILKQATHYAERYNTPFVALCDYNTLVLLVMNKEENYHGGQYMYMTVVKNSAVMRKAYLGFLLAARLNKENDNDWRKNPKGDDLFVKAEDWDHLFQSGDVEKKSERSGKNSAPVHDTPSSQENDASKKDVQSD